LRYEKIEAKPDTTRKAVLRLLLSYNAATEHTRVVQTYDETYNNTPLASANWVG
jgi:hypothetical protein